MKRKFLLLSLLCLLFTAACKKNSDPASDDNKRIKEQVIGSWQPVDQTTVYYDKSGKVATSTTEQQTVNYRIYEFSANNVFKIKEPARQTIYQYAIDLVNGKQQLNIKDENGTIIQTCNIDIINDTMVWTAEQDINNDPNYSKGSITVNFRRQ